MQVLVCIFKCAVWIHSTVRKVYQALNEFTTTMSIMRVSFKIFLSHFSFSLITVVFFLFYFQIGTSYFIQRNVLFPGPLKIKCTFKSIHLKIK